VLAVTSPSCMALTWSTETLVVAGYRAFSKLLAPVELSVLCFRSGLQANIRQTFIHRVSAIDVPKRICGGSMFQVWGKSRRRQICQTTLFACKAQKHDERCMCSKKGSDDFALCDVILICWVVETTDCEPYPKTFFVLLFFLDGSSLVYFH